MVFVFRLLVAKKLFLRNLDKWLIYWRNNSYKRWWS